MSTWTSTGCSPTLQRRARAGPWWVCRKRPETVEALAQWVREMHKTVTEGEHTPQDPGPMAPHFHADEDGQAGYLHTHDEAGAGHTH